MTQPERRRETSDGNRWRTLDANVKMEYVVGFIDGIFLGHCFTTWGLPASQQDDPCWTNATKSYTANWERLVSNKPYQYYVEGLDELYAEERNRNIEIHDGMNIVMNLSLGPNDEDRESMMDAWRHKAVDDLRERHNK